jgi:predicted ribonuclease YlaK
MSKNKKYTVKLSETEIDFLRDCIDFQFQMSGYDDLLMEKDKWQIKDKNKLIDIEEKLKNVVYPPIKLNLPNQTKLEKLMMEVLSK